MDSKVRVSGLRIPRAGLCFELAYNGIMTADDEHLILVHGRVDARDENLVHAWVIDPTDGTVYDPVLDECFASEAEFHRRFDAIPEMRYSRAEAAKAWLLAKRHGLWHRDPGPIPEPESSNGPWLMYAITQARSQNR